MVLLSVAHPTLRVIYQLCAQQQKPNMMWLEIVRCYTGSPVFLPIDNVSIHVPGSKQTIL
jgi:hypothetical protein